MNEDLLTIDITDPNKPKKQDCPTRSKNNQPVVDANAQYNVALVEFLKTDPENFKDNVDFYAEFAIYRKQPLLISQALAVTAKLDNAIQASIGGVNPGYGRSGSKVIIGGAHIRNAKEFFSTLSNDPISQRALILAKAFGVSRSGEFWTLVIE